MYYAFVLIIAYLFGSIPFGYLLVHFKEKSDVRKAGADGTGADSLNRETSRSINWLAVLLDIAKGMSAVLFAQLILPHDDWLDWWVGLTAFTVIVGHCYPIWLGFRGGKGVATSVGIFLALAPLALICAGLVFLKVIWDTRFMSLGSIMACASLPVFILLLTFLKPTPNSLPLIFTSLICSALVILMHGENIKRLVRGTENKFY